MPSNPSASASTSHHGHVVLHLLAETPMTEESLRQYVCTQLGRQARFHTCDTTDLSFDDLLALLIARQKISRSAEGLRTERSRICADDTVGG